MSWTSIDDRILMHPKMLRACELKGDAAWCLWTRGLIYTNAYDLDGRIPRGMVCKLVDHRRPQDVAAALVEVRLWELREDGDYQVHDYADVNDTAERKQRRRTAAREKKQRQRDRAAGIEDGEEQPKDNPPATPPGKKGPSVDVVPQGHEGDRTGDGSGDQAGDRGGSPSAYPIHASPNQADPSQAEPGRGRAAPVSSPAVSAKEQEILDAVRRWPVLAVLDDVAWVRATLATAGASGWSQADVLAGIEEYGQKRGPSAALTGAPPIGEMSNGVVGFTKNASLRRRAGATPSPEQIRALQAKGGQQQGSAGPGADLLAELGLRSAIDSALAVPAKPAPIPEELSAARLFTAFDAGYRRATNTPLDPHRRTTGDADLLLVQWRRYSERHAGATADGFLEALTESVADWVQDTNNDADRRFQGGFSVPMFVKWVAEQRAAEAASARPTAGPPGPVWGEPSPEEIAAFDARDKAGER